VTQEKLTAVFLYFSPTPPCDIVGDQPTLRQIWVIKHCSESVSALEWRAPQQALNQLTSGNGRASNADRQFLLARNSTVYFLADLYLLYGIIVSYSGKPAGQGSISVRPA